MKFLEILKLIITLAAVLPVAASASSSKYTLDESWPEKSVSNLEKFGSGIDIDIDGNIVVLHRSTYNNRKEKAIIPENTVIIIDQNSGEILREWGSNLFSKPHGVTVTEEGDIFITDVNLHQVFKFDYNNKTKLWNETPSIELGERFTEGTDKTHFCSPAAVAVMPKTGEFYVADGYCNSRIVKFCKHGHYQIEFGAGTSTSPFPGGNLLQFNVAHSVALTFRREMQTIENSNSSVDAMVVVTDRNNGRIQCFTTNGTFMYEISSEYFGEEKSWIFAVAVFANNHDDSKFSFGRILAINGHVKAGQPRVFEIGLNDNNFAFLSTFPSSPNSERTSHSHDIANKDGQIFIIEAFDYLTIRKFNSINSVSSSRSLSSFISSSCVMLSIMLSVIWTQGSWKSLCNIMVLQQP